MTVKKSSSTYDVIDSGIIMTFDADSSVKFDLELDISFKFSIEIDFKKDPSIERDLKQSVDMKKNLIKIICINFDNSLGTGTTKPIELATHQGKKLYIHFWVYALGTNSTRKVDYCIYRER